MAKKAILIIEDDRDIRQSLGAILEEEGYPVVEAENGAVGLRELRDGHEVSLVLLDLMMPVMDGWAFCREWEADAALAAIPVIIVSADGTTDRKAATCGANGYLRKPVQLDALLELAEKYAA